MNQTLSQWATQIDWVELSKIGATALFSILSAWLLDKRHTKQERERQKTRDQKLLKRLKLEEQQRATLQLIRDLQFMTLYIVDTLQYTMDLAEHQESEVPEATAHMLLEKAKAVEDAQIELRKSAAGFSTLDIPADAQLASHLQQLANVATKISSIGSSLPNKPSQGAQPYLGKLTKLAYELGNIGGKIDNRFETLKSQVISL